MTTEDLLVDDSSNREAVEAVGESLPQFDVIPPLALVVESIDAVDGSALVIPTQKEEVLWVLDFVSEEQTDGLQRLFTAVHVVPEEQVI